jgi:phage shock PspC-like protein
LYLPEGTIFIANSNTQNFRRYYNSSNEILKRGMEDHFLKVIEDDVECLDCEPEPETKVEASVFESEESKIQESIIKESEINYEITEEDGVNIDN